MGTRVRFTDYLFVYFIVCCSYQNDAWCLVLLAIKFEFSQNKKKTVNSLSKLHENIPRQKPTAVDTLECNGYVVYKRFLFASSLRLHVSTRRGCPRRWLMPVKTCKISTVLARHETSDVSRRYQAQQWNSWYYYVTVCTEVT